MMHSHTVESKDAFVEYSSKNNLSPQQNRGESTYTIYNVHAYIYIYIHIYTLSRVWCHPEEKCAPNKKCPSCTRKPPRLQLAPKRWAPKASVWFLPPPRNPSRKPLRSDHSAELEELQLHEDPSAPYLGSMSSSRSRWWFFRYFWNFHPEIWVFPKIRDTTPKWMVKIVENPILKWDDLGGKPTIFGNIHLGR